MRKKIKNCYETIKKELLDKYSSAQTELIYKTDFELLCAIILSAQCTDARVNKITPLLFEQYKTPYEMANAQIEDLQKIIGSCSYFRAKAANIISTAKTICEKYDGKVPATEQELILLAGVGQKTAHVFLIEFYNQDFMAVDTHVFRVSHRLGLSKDKTAKQTEATLVGIFKTDLNRLHQAFVLFGRYLCKAKKPLCDECFLKECCISTKVFKPNG